MKRDRCQLCLFFSFVAIIVLLSTCTRVVRTSDIPPLQTGSPLSGIHSKIFAFKEFEDIRETRDPRLMMVGPGNKYVLEEPPATLTARKVRDELQRNGHVCINYTPHAKADFIVEGSVYKYSVSRAVGYIAQAFVGYAAVKLTIRRVPSDTGVMVKSYEGKYTADSISHSGWSIALTQATLAMIKEISTDTELVDFVQR